MVSQQRRQIWPAQSAIRILALQRQWGVGLLVKGDFLFKVNCLLMKTETIQQCQVPAQEATALTVASCAGLFLLLANRN